LKDLGLSTPDSSNNEFLYFAPELFQPDDEVRECCSNNVGKADVYAMGVLVMEMLTGRTPDPLTRDEMVEGLGSKWPLDVVEFIEECVAYDPEERPGLEYVGTFLLERNSSNDKQ
jgi:serine/threonine protein kinase